MYEIASKKSIQPLPDDLIKNLLFGNTKLKGLLTLSGKDNPISRIACLNLLSTLLNYEIYPFAESIQKIFATSNVNQIKEMHLERDIKMPSTKNSPGLVLLYFYTSMNDMLDPDIENLLSDSKAFKVYSKWFEQKVDKGYLFSKSKIFQTKFYSSHKFNADNLKFEDLSYLISNRSESIILGPVEISSSRAQIKSLMDKILFLNKDKLFWEINSELSKDGLIVQENDSCGLFRITATLDDFDMLFIYSIITSYEKYSKHLPKLLGGTTLRPFENGEDIVHLVYRDEDKMKELILLRQISTKNPQDELLLGLTSINVNYSEIKNSKIEKSYLNPAVLKCTQIKLDNEIKKVEFDFIFNLSNLKKGLLNSLLKTYYLEYCLSVLKRIKQGSNLSLNKFY